MNQQHRHTIVYCCECCGARLRPHEDGKICARCAHRIDADLRQLRLGRYSEQKGRYN